jgi:hypothetical protein
VLDKFCDHEKLKIGAAQFQKIGAAKSQKTARIKESPPLAARWTSMLARI